jgi:hypothetical protein
VNVLRGHRLTAASVLALALALGACQSILGINSNPLLVSGEPDGGDGGDNTQVDSGPVGHGDSGGPDATQTDSGDAAVDASDGSVVDSGPDADTGLPPSFDNPTQIDMTALFSQYGVNTVVTTTVGGVPLTAMDGISTSGNDDFPTVSAILALTADSGTPLMKGLPDNAFFPSPNASIPAVHLAWTNTVNQANSIVVNSTAGTQYTFNVPEAVYTQLQIYATGGNGGSTVDYTLTYSDLSTTQSTLALPDWCVGTLGFGQYVLVGVYRVQNGDALNGENPQDICNIYALDLNPDTCKALSSVTLENTGGSSTTYLVFYGATAW